MKYRTRTYAQGVFDTFFFEKNLQGDVIGVYDSTGTKLITYTYDAWGNFRTTYATSGSGALGKAVRNPFRYRGYYYDTDSGWYYLQTRYYNPVWGRFINADGYVSTDTGFVGFNMYAYCDNNPVIYADDSGEFPWLVVVAIIAVVAVIAVDHSVAKNHPEGVQLIEDRNGDALTDKIFYVEGKGASFDGENATLFDLDAGVYSGVAEEENYTVSLATFFTVEAAAKAGINDNKEVEFELGGCFTIYKMFGDVTFSLFGTDVTLEFELNVGAFGGGIEWDNGAAVTVPSFGIVPKFGFKIGGSD